MDLRSERWSVVDWILLASVAAIGGIYRHGGGTLGSVNGVVFL
jgi:hypothetical protein